MEERVLMEITEHCPEEDRRFTAKMIYLDAVLDYFVNNNLYDGTLQDVKDAVLEVYI